MGTIHQLLEQEGKLAAIEQGTVPRDVIEAAAQYLSDEDNALALLWQKFRVGRRFGIPTARFA